jgi:ABC-type ATPase with predicted acetyltransferase domain
MQPSTQPRQTSEIEVLVIWYCRGCKRSVEVLVHPEAQTVICPNCQTEKDRHKF